VRVKICTPEGGGEKRAASLRWLLSVINAAPTAFGKNPSTVQCPGRRARNGELADTISQLVHVCNDILSNRIGVLTSSARAGPGRRSRLTRWKLFGTISGELPGTITSLEEDVQNQLVTAGTKRSQ
jgi:hypothetical protein